MKNCVLILGEKNVGKSIFTQFLIKSRIEFQNNIKRFYLKNENIINFSPNYFHIYENSLLNIKIIDCPGITHIPNKNNKNKCEIINIFKHENVIKVIYIISNYNPFYIYGTNNISLQTKFIQQIQDTINYFGKLKRTYGGENIDKFQFYFYIKTLKDHISHFDNYFTKHHYFFQQLLEKCLQDNDIKSNNLTLKISIIPDFELFSLRDEKQLKTEILSTPLQSVFTYKQKRLFLILNKKEKNNFWSKIPLDIWKYMFDIEECFEFKYSNFNCNQ